MYVGFEEPKQNVMIEPHTTYTQDMQNTRVQLLNYCTQNAQNLLDKEHCIACIEHTGLVEHINRAHMHAEYIQPILSQFRIVCKLIINNYSSIEIPGVRSEN